MLTVICASHAANLPKLDTRGVTMRFVNMANAAGFEASHASDAPIVGPTLGERASTRQIRSFDLLRKAATSSRSPSIASIRTTRPAAVRSARR